MWFYKDVTREEFEKVKDRIQEIHLADLTKGKNSTPKENLKHISALWNLIEENFQLDKDYDTEYQMSARNAIFG